MRVHHRSQGQYFLWNLINNGNRLLSSKYQHQTLGNKSTLICAMILWESEIEVPHAKSQYSKQGWTGYCTMTCCVFLLKKSEHIVPVVRRVLLYNPRGVLTEAKAFYVARDVRETDRWNMKNWVRSAIVLISSSCVLCDYIWHVSKAPSCTDYNNNNNNKKSVSLYTAVIETILILQMTNYL